MVAADIDFLIATPDDASTVAGIITEVSEGVIDHLLGGVFPGMKPQSILEMILARGSGNLDLKNILLVNVGGELAGLLFAYDSKLQKVSDIMLGFLGETKVNEMRPLLEAKADNAYWINTLWVNEAFRGQGLAQLLIKLAEDMARGVGCSSLALHCWADNERARRFYEHQNFVLKGEIPTASALKARHPKAGELWVKQLADDARNVQ